MKTWKIIILLSYISIASASTVIINPALPYIAKEFALSDGNVEWLISIFLIGYVIGQIIYGPIANKYGEVKALRAGLIINILGILICLIGGYSSSIIILLIGRLITSLGAAAGLVCTFIILNNSVSKEKTKIALSFASISFALSVGVAILIGGLITYYSSWINCFYVLLIHGLIMFGLSFLFKEEKILQIEINVLNILNSYRNAFKSKQLIIFSLTLGMVSAFSYCYTASGPFITKDILGFTSAEYGYWNFITITGIIAGSFLATKIINKYSHIHIIVSSIILILIVFLLLSLLTINKAFTSSIFFFLMTCCYFINSFIYPTAAYIASNSLEDKANASGTMNFINMATAVVCVTIMGYIPFAYIWKFTIVCVTLSIICLILIFWNKINNRK
ncbi:MFS transporter [Francisella frigiditurris]|uniref:Sugar (And other) transporter family protein n=1 Tax=Francisella frigiditurris TaxID=1542390 RepID=A0A1J0KRC8_9GAMM|nr:MFS transporter [Francisella frigiditurris]APC96312.1 sugar (and other) transporter family protein [Francisella frigiditurris]